MEWLARLLHTHRRELLLYACIGMSGAVLDVAVYWVETATLGVTPWCASLVSSTIGAVNNFALNARFNFRTADRWWRRFATYYLICVGGIAASAAVVYVLHDLASQGALVAKLASIPLVVLAQYALNRRFTFARPLAEQVV